jgi:DNA-binding transcriptional regulator YiaG
VFAKSDTTSLTESAIDAPKAKFTTAEIKLARIQLHLSADSMSIGMNAAVSVSSDTSGFQEYV